jgi:hypothetical protein
MRPKAMKEKKDMVENWLPRYTGTPGSTSSLSISRCDAPSRLFAPPTSVS